MLRAATTETAQRIRAISRPRNSETGGVFGPLERINSISLIAINAYCVTSGIPEFQAASFDVSSLQLLQLFGLIVVLLALRLIT